ncbi:S49 family peptidase [Actinophytocola oryzae]|uniref:Signal peptide peptidase SppA n=1 Tax=Actinophytocola oryzae TaxID=502181 RepID=A0A4R7VNK0_9PSEU|nr:S49 family peptidase [Actinophytocola oryzae]TDV50908.1 signal peptide peptidase SppA [Actinophytocola oryzae]
MSVTEKLAARLPMKSGTTKPVVAVVKLHGVITPNPSPLSRGTININTVEQALTKAFDHERLRAVALAINSPGGAPTQSALVSERIRELAERKKVPVLAFCEDVAASGGYWLACAADEIYAHPSSLVGSIGVVTSGFGLNGLLERFGVERRVYTAGAHKVRLDPFQQEKDEDVEWLKGLQSQLHEQFVGWVRSRRGDRLGDGDDLFTGEIWTGAKAKELGLVDDVGSLRTVLARRYPEAEVTVAEPKRPLLARLGIGGATQSLLTAVEHRALWSRYGL